MIHLLAFSASYGGTFWYADSVKSLNEVKVTAYPYGWEVFLHLRDYRPYAPAQLHGDTYALNAFRFYVRRSFGGLGVSVGDEPLTFGRGLSLFLADDEKALLEATLRGIHLNYSFLRAYAGLKRRWIYYSSDRDTLLLAGLSLTPGLPFGEAGLNLSLYDAYGRREGYGVLPGAYATLPLGPVALYLEGAYRYGYDLATYGRNYGYALYGNLEYARENLVLGAEAKDYYRIYEEFNLPTPANGYGLLPTEGRDEMGGNVYLSYTTLSLELGRSYSHDGELVMKYYAASYYRDVGPFTLKVGSHHLDWEGNLNERQAFLEVKYNAPLGVVAYAEYRRRLPHGEWEDQPYASLTFIYGGLTLSLSGRYYALSKKTDRVLEVSYDNFSFLRVFASYGSFSGDVVCSSGVCRYEPPFTGVKVGLNLYLTR